MRRIAISGHRGLPAQVERRVTEMIRAALTETEGEITGLSCIADGPDQIFAREVLNHGGTIEAIIPAEKYRAALPDEAHDEYDRLMNSSAHVHHMSFTESDSEAHMAASAYMIDHASELWAVWDGLPARGYGGTADAVAYAREKRVPVRIIWPDGAQRD